MGYGDWWYNKSDQCRQPHHSCTMFILIEARPLIEARHAPIFNSYRYVPLIKSLKLLYFTIKYVAFCTDLL